MALSQSERRVVLDVLHSERFVDAAPRQIYATLLDEGRYLCSVRTMYRILEAEQELRERRNQCRRPVYTKPELLATVPNQVWSWDLTKLKGPAKWSYFYLYVILDIFSRYVVGWMVARRESATLALLLADLGVTKTHSRPYTSTDNPYSEAQFKTLKYRPEFPDRFGSIEDARALGRSFFPWYNHAHRHSGLALLTPADVHYGHAPQRLEQRSRVLDEVFQVHPERFKGRRPMPAELPGAVWIDPRPKTTPEDAPGSALFPLPDAEVPPLTQLLRSESLEQGNSTTPLELP